MTEKPKRRYNRNEDSTPAQSRERRLERLHRHRESQRQRAALLDITARLFGYASLDDLHTALLANKATIINK